MSSKLKKVLKWMGILLLVLIVLLFTAYTYVAHNISGRMEKRYSFSPANLVIPTDSASLERGRHLVAIKGCNDCHGDNLGGKVMAEDGAIGRLVASNITKGKGGLPAGFNDKDWIMALQHGIDPTGRPLLLMPSHETTQLSEPDMAAVIAYCKTLPPVDHVTPSNRIGPVAKIMTYLGKMPLLSVEMIDHNKALVKQVDTTESAAHGQYLTVSCSGCHRPDMKGGDPIAPGFPKVPNITASGNPGKWSEKQFLRTLRTGLTPAGHQMKPEEMPWKMTAQYSDVELKSIFKYLRSLK